MKVLTPEDFRQNLLVIPDCQNAPDHPIEHLKALGNWILDNKPDWVHDSGDWNDNKAAGRYESEGVKGLKKRSIKEDLDWAKHCNDVLWGPVNRYNKKANKTRRYNPRKTRTLGNHENRLVILSEATPWIKELIFNEENFNEKEHNIEVFPFLEVIEISGVMFSHFFPISSDGTTKQTNRGQANARLQVQRLAQSATAGHQQGLSTHTQTTPKKRLRGVIAGSFYMHDEDYMGPSGNNYWRGVLYKRNIQNGDYDLQEISLNSLLEEYL